MVAVRSYYWWNGCCFRQRGFSRHHFFAVDSRDRPACRLQRRGPGHEELRRWRCQRCKCINISHYITTSGTITKPTNRRTKANFISFPLAFRMKRIWRRQMRKECGVPTSNRVFRKHLQYILLVDDGKLYYQMKAKCMVSAFVDVSRVKINSLC